MPSESKNDDDNDVAVAKPARRMSQSDIIRRRLSTTGATLDPVILGLIDWGTSEEFEEKLEAWMEDNCSSFVEAGSLKEEQNLEWGNVYTDYLDWLDAKLTKFCKEFDYDEDDVAKRMQECMQAHAEEEFFPAFMSNTEYNVFVKQMHELATVKTRAAEAEEAEHLVLDNGVMNLSGSWMADPSKYDPESAEEGLKHVHCPWVFRKVLKRAAKLVKDITITQTNTDLSVAFTIHMFGTSANTFTYGERCPDTNLWNKPVEIVCDQPTSEGIFYRQFGSPGIPEDTRHENRMWVEDNGERMLWECKVYRPDLDLEKTYTQYFLRRHDLSEGGGSHK